MQTIRLVHLIPTLEPGGAERLVLESVPLLTRRGYDVHVVAGVAGGSLETLFQREPCQLFIASRVKLGGRLAALLAVWKYLKKNQPSILHTHLFSSDVIGWMWKMWHKKVVWVSTIHNLEHNRPWWYRIIWRCILPFANQVIVVSSGVHNYVEQKFKISSPRLITINNGINLTRWQNASTQILFQREPVALATIGRLEKQKGHVDLLAALSLLKDLSWKCHIFGEGRERQILETRAKSLGIADRLIWHGVSLTLPDEFDALDIIVQPSRWEGMSLTVMEALASGRCVVGTKAAGDGLIEDNVTGYLVADENPSALAERLRYIFSHKAEAQTRAERARLTAGRFSISRQVDELVRVYKSLGVF